MALGSSPPAADATGARLPSAAGARTRTSRLPALGAATAKARRLDSASARRGAAAEAVRALCLAAGGEGSAAALPHAARGMQPCIVCAADGGACV